jgi:hypothetical protein
MAYRPIPEKAVTIMDLYNQAIGKTQSPVIPKQQVPEEKLGKLSKTIQPNGGVEKSVIEPIKEPAVRSIKKVPKEPIKAIPKEPIREVPREPIKAIPKEPIKKVPKEPIKPQVDPHHRQHINQVPAGIGADRQRQQMMVDREQKLHMQRTVEELNLQRNRLKENLQSLNNRGTEVQTRMDEWVRRAREHHMPPHQYQEMLEHSGEMRHLKSRLGDINRERTMTYSRLGDLEGRADHVSRQMHNMASLAPNQMSPSGHNKIIR